MFENSMVGSTILVKNSTSLKNDLEGLAGGDSSITREASKEAAKRYNLRRNTRIQSHPYQVNNMLIFTKKFNNLSLEDMYISKSLKS